MITVQEVRQYIKVDPSGDDMLRSLIASVVDDWEMATCRKWTHRTNYVQTWELRDENQEYLWTDLYPVETIALTQYYTWEDPTAAEVVDPTTIIVTPDRGRIRSVRRGFTPFQSYGWWKNIVTATITGGYTPDTCPAGVKRALLVEAQFRQRRFSDEKIIVKGQSINRNVTTFMDATYHPYFVQQATMHQRQTYIP